MGQQRCTYFIWLQSLGSFHHPVWRLSCELWVGPEASAPPPSLTFYLLMFSQVIPDLNQTGVELAVECRATKSCLPGLPLQWDVGLQVLLRNSPVQNAWFVQSFLWNVLLFSTERPPFEELGEILLWCQFRMNWASPKYVAWGLLSHRCC